MIDCFRTINPRGWASCLDPLILIVVPSKVWFNYESGLSLLCLAEVGEFEHMKRASSTCRGRRPSSRQAGAVNGTLWVAATLLLFLAIEFSTFLGLRLWLQRADAGHLCSLPLKESQPEALKRSSIASLPAPPKAVRKAPSNYNSWLSLVLSSRRSFIRVPLTKSSNSDPSNALG